MAAYDGLVRSSDDDEASSATLLGAGNPFQILERERYATYVSKLGTQRPDGANRKTGQPAHRLQRSGVGSISLGVRSRTTPSLPNRTYLGHLYRYGINRRG